MEAAGIFFHLHVLSGVPLGLPLGLRTRHAAHSTQWH
jgi:hypothetical protein